jgi:hypothetical protein
MANEDRRQLAPADEGPMETEGVGENLCRECNGSGRQGEEPCGACAGTGIVAEGVGGA